jgi:hypothetical protein
MTNGPHKVRIKIGDAEFEAEGSEESVKQQYADFLGALENRRAAPPPPVNPAAQKQQAATGENASTTVSSLDADLLNKVFKLDGDLVSLHFLPRGDNVRADALMLLLYGYATLKNQAMVLGTQLVRAANQSGLGLDRVDRSLESYESQNMVLRGGVRKGTKYGLNNPGKIRAEELLKALPI